MQKNNKKNLQNNNEHISDYLQRIDEWMFMHVDLIMDKTPER